MFSKMLSALLLLLLLGYVSAEEPEVDFGFCTLEENGPDALTNFFYGVTVPRSCIEIDGLERCYYTYHPTTCGWLEQAVPLVFDIHGRNQCPLRSVQYTGWVQKAEEECFILVMPISTGGADGAFPEACYNSPGFLTSPDMGTPDGNNVTTSPCCCVDETGNASFDEPDDPKFISLVVKDVLKRFNEKGFGNPTIQDSSSSSKRTTTTALTIDPDRVYLGGHSNGCILALSTAQLYSDTIAAVCCHAGALVTPPASDYTPVPILMIHGEEDRIVRYDGEFETVPGIGDIGLWSVPQTTEQLLRQNGCSDSEAFSLNDNSTGVVVEGTGCDAPVKVVTLPDAGHLPFKLPFLPAPEFYGGSLTTEDTTGLAWDFCSAQSRATLPTTPAPSSSATDAPIQAPRPALAPSPSATDAPIQPPSESSSTSIRSSKALTWSLLFVLLLLIVPN